MNRAEALARLGIEGEPTPAEIEAAFRRRAQDEHPDKVGDEGDFAALSEAREIALREPSPQALAVWKSAELDARRIALLDKEERQKEARETVGGIVRVHVARLQTQVRAASIFGLAAGVPGAVIGYVGLTAGDYATGMIAPPLLVIAGFFGFLSLTARFRIHALEAALDDAATALADRGTYAAALNEISSAVEDHGDLMDLSYPFGREELSMAIDLWLSRGAHRPRRPGDMRTLVRATLSGRRMPNRVLWVTLRQLAFQIGAEDFSRLLISKGLENGLLKASESVVDGALLTSYELQLASEEAD